MSWFPSFGFQRRKRELQEEIDAHLQMAIGDRMARGQSTAEAKTSALREFGSVPMIADVTREQWGWLRLELVVQDIRYALRQLRRTPGFTVTVLLTLALGIGANSAIFTLVNAILLRNLPVTDPKSLIRIGDRNDCCISDQWSDSGDYSLFATDTYYMFKKNLPEFEELAATASFYGGGPLTVRRAGPETVAKSMVGTFVSGNYFQMFGLSPAAGRLFMDADDQTGAPVTAVISYEAWQRDYAGDRSVAGSTFYINGKPVTIVGVAPKGFYGDRIDTNPPSFFFPMHAMDALIGASFFTDPNKQWAYIIGRVKPGTSLPALQANASALLKHQLATLQMFTDPRAQKVLPLAHVVLTPGGGGIQNMQNGYKDRLKLLQWIAVLVLLVACANIANLLLVRGMSRHAEFSLRSALGAQRTRLVRQLLQESIVLSCMGGLLGLAISYLGAHALLALAFPDQHNMPVAASPSPLVIGFAFALSLATGIFFGLAPALMAARTRPAGALRANSRTTAHGASFLQRGLVVMQAALSLVLLVAAGLFAQSLTKAEKVNMKLDTTNRYVVHFNPHGAGYKTTDVELLYQTIVDRFHAIPGVLKVGVSTYTPMEANDWNSGVKVQGDPDLHKTASWVKAAPEYFGAVGTHVVMGRGFTPQDTMNAPPVAVVNQEFVKQFFGNRNPIGHRFGFDDPLHPGTDGAHEIVGVVEDTTYTSVYWKNHAMYFLPLAQPAGLRTPGDPDQSVYAGAIVIETSHSIPGFEKVVGDTLASINPNLTILKFQTFRQQIDNRFTQERLISRLTSLFGLLALLLAAIGLDGVTAYTVVRRAPEIGVRMALGAARSRVIGMVMRGAMLQTVAGLAIGIPVAIFCVRYVKSQLYEITSVNVPVMAVAIGVLTFAAAIAGIIPARRAASIDPVRALRIE
ncbi:ABC transporter permease [Occallatibacter riparius]|uniref:ABC transporter permease n=1 Tax=Occallatibacter riparius TaxID=1002689 RepID=A0A9J7BMI4_9BACT|nr:ABC transporter permease [Occallatibacter riparius]UWZ83944.1 ABC transporter permease [Occallatibacter riparius]